MSSAERENPDEPDFRWGKRRGVGGKKKEIRFYESFTYDGVDYALYDCVYLYNQQDEDRPHIGKLIRIWQNADQSKKIKVQWFFRASEISHWLQTHKLKALDNEIFFASGEGVGLTNVIPLEVLVGKCVVVCTSEDRRNPKPSAEQLQMADYVFYRTFDVGKYIISDKMDERIGGLEVKYLFNKQENEMIIGQIGSKPKEEDNRIAVVFEETLELSGKKPHQVAESTKSDGNRNDLVAEDKEVNNLQVKDEPVGGCEGQVMDELPEVQKSNHIEEHVDAQGIEGIMNHDSMMNQQDLEISTAGSFGKCLNPDIGKDPLLVNNFGKDSSSLGDGSSLKPEAFVCLHDRPAKKPRVEDLSQRLDQKVVHDHKNDVTRKPGMVNKSRLENMGKHTKSTKELDKDLSNKMCDGRSMEDAKDSFGCDGPSKKRFSANSSEPIQSSFVIDKDSCSHVDGSKKGFSKEKVGGKMSMPNNNSLDVGPIVEKPIGNRSKSMKASIPMHKGVSEKNFDKNNTLSGYNFGKTSEASFVVGKTYEVTPRPTNGKGWFTSDHGEDLKDAHDGGRVILLQNLDPEWTSGEVEDILWSAFKEKCTAKMVPRTAFSSPYYGQALVILRTREAAERVLGKLNGGCLLICNERPLVGSIVNFPKPTKKQRNFAGHLSTDKMKLQMQRDKKDALSTSHFSQANTMEYELAMEWCLLQSKHAHSWEMLNKSQGEELMKCMAELKSSAMKKE